MGLGWAGWGAGLSAGLGRAGSLAHVENENMKIQFEAKFTQLLVILFLKV